MRVGIIDADLLGRGRHRFPNLACMKISAYRKSLGDTVELLTDYEQATDYPVVYLSKVFTDTTVPDFIFRKCNLIYGGTGFFYDKASPLPDEIEHTFPDYHLYDAWVDTQLRGGGRRLDYKYYTDYSIGFLTRGCFRKCPFCVNHNYNHVTVHSPLEEFVDPTRRGICLLDDNFFGCSNWKDLLFQLRATGKPFQFKQGLDERLLTDEKCKLLFSSRYDGDFVFAFDNIVDYDIIESKLKCIRNHTHAIPKFYVFCGFDYANRWDIDFWKQDLIDLWKRIELLMRYRCLAYVMRFNRYRESPYAGFYVAVSRWCNQPSFYKKLSFREFVQKDQGTKPTPVASMRALQKIELEIPGILTPYFDLKFESNQLKEDPI